MRLLPVILCLLYCSSVNSQKVYKENIPPEFKSCSGCILVILKKEPDKNDSKLDQKVDRKMIEFVEKFIKLYEGKTAYITKAEFDSNSIYRDSTVYRFILNTGLYNYSASVQKDKGYRIEIQSSERTGLNLHLYDRVLVWRHLQLSNWAGWEKNFEKVAEALNKALKKEE